MTKIYTKFYSSPVGFLEINATETSIIGLNFRDKEEESDTQLPDVLKQCLKELDEYFAGHRQKFDVAVELEGTDFQKSVWVQLKNIPYGNTSSYGDIAKRIKNPNSFRAVGLANNRNKISIILPCHRVIGSDGSMVGYGGGLWRKEWLLEHEQKFIA